MTGACAISAAVKQTIAAPTTAMATAGADTGAAHSPTKHSAQSSADSRRVVSAGTRSRSRENTVCVPATSTVFTVNTAPANQPARRSSPVR